MEKISYHVVLFREPEGGYTVTVPALSGCITYGDDEKHALEMAREAMELYLECGEELDMEFTYEIEVLLRRVEVDVPPEVAEYVRLHSKATRDRDKHTPLREYGEKRNLES